MERYDSAPERVIAGWPSTDVLHPANERVPFHYHGVEEWLEVKAGALHFFTAGEREFPVMKGQALRIPPGEVHRVEIGPDGTTYRMWTPREEVDQTFAHQVSDEQLQLIKRNLSLPEVENRWEQRNRAEPSQQDGADESFLRDLLSAALTFRTVKGIYLDRDGYLGRPQPKPAVVKSSSGSVQVLYATAETILLSTVVETQGADGVRASFANARLFIKEDGLWKCRVWLNSPEPSTS